MDPTLIRLLLGSAAPLSRGNPAELLGQLAPATARAHRAPAQSPYAPARIETLDRRAYLGHLLLRYDPGDPAVDDAVAVAWVVTMLRSARSIVLADDGCLTSPSIESALRALVNVVHHGHDDVVLEPLVAALLDAAHAGYGTRLQLWTERCAQTGGRAIVIAPEQKTSDLQPGATAP